MAFDLDDDELKATRILHGVDKEIEVGEYVRTKYGEIGIITETFPKIKWIKRVNPSLLDYNLIKNHSFEQMDLVEVGDVIQLKGAEELKYEVLKISWSKSKGKHIHIINPFRTEGGKDIFIEDIKSILTKEQFNANCYEVKE